MGGGRRRGVRGEERERRGERRGEGREILCEFFY